MSERVRQAIRKLTDEREVFTGIASDIDPAAGTCAVTPSDGSPPWFEVALKAHPSATSYVIPADGSQVVVLKYSQQSAAIIAAADVQRLVWQVEDTLLEVTPEGLTLSRSTESLKALLTDLCAAIEQITVPTAVGPSGVPVNIPAFVQIRTRIAQLLT